MSISFSATGQAFAVLNGGEIGKDAEVREGLDAAPWNPAGIGRRYEVTLSEAAAARVWVFLGETPLHYFDRGPADEVRQQIYDQLFPEEKIQRRKEAASKLDKRLRAT